MIRRLRIEDFCPKAGERVGETDAERANRLELQVTELSLRIATITMRLFETAMERDAALWHVHDMLRKQRPAAGPPGEPPSQQAVALLNAIRAHQIQGAR